MWKKIHNTWKKNQEALNSSSIFALYFWVERVFYFLLVFYLTHAFGTENHMGHGQNFVHFLYLPGFTHFGPDMSLAQSCFSCWRLRQFCCAGCFLVPCDLMDKTHVSMSSFSGLGNVPRCRIPRLSLICTTKKGRAGKIIIFIQEKKKKALFPFNVSQDLKMLGQRERFFFLWSCYSEGGTFMLIIVLGRRETWNVEWPGFLEVSRDWKWLPPQRNAFLVYKQDWTLESAQFRGLRNWRFMIFSQCPCLVSSVSALAKYTNI